MGTESPPAVPARTTCPRRQLPITGGSAGAHQRPRPLEPCEGPLAVVHRWRAVANALEWEPRSAGKRALRGNLRLVDLQVRCDESAPSAARQALQGVEAVGRPIRDLTLIASELVTNAVLYSGAPRRTRSSCGSSGPTASSGCRSWILVAPLKARESPLRSSARPVGWDCSWSSSWRAAGARNGPSATACGPRCRLATSASLSSPAPGAHPSDQLAG